MVKSKVGKHATDRPDKESSVVSTDGGITGNALRNGALSSDTNQQVPARLKARNSN